MARLHFFLSIACAAFVQSLLTGSLAHQPRSFSYQRQAVGRYGIEEHAGVSGSATTESRVSELKSEIADLLWLKESAKHLLDSASFQEAVRLSRREGDEAYDASTEVEEADSDEGDQNTDTTEFFLEDLIERLTLLREMLQALADLLSRFGIEPSSKPTASQTSSSPQDAASSSRTSTSNEPSVETGSADNMTMTDGPIYTNQTDGPSSTAMTSSPSYSSKTELQPTDSPDASYRFAPMSSSNVAVYYGQSDETGRVPLSDVCEDPHVDIIVLAFINKLSVGTAGYPGLNMGPHCWVANDAQLAAGATGLIDCVSDGFAKEVQACQDTGKKVLISIGGAAGFSDTTINSEDDAVRIADNIWDLFGAGAINNSLVDIRPFGDFIFDGFDIDNEDHSTLYWPTLISTLREHFLDYSPSYNTNTTSSASSRSRRTKRASNANKAYFLSAAPQCPRPDASIPLSSMQSHIDFIFVQFYNNPSCQLDSSGFYDSLTAWSDEIADPAREEPFMDTGNGVVSPRVFVGALAFPFTGGGSGNSSHSESAETSPNSTESTSSSSEPRSRGWIDGATYFELMQNVSTMNLPNLGGAMLWDGAYGVLSAETDGVEGRSGLGRTYMDLAKEGLEVGEASGDTEPSP